jgi:hypothetical protein
VVIAADYPFLDVIWTMIVFFAWVIWFWLLITILADVFRRHDLSGIGKVGWTVFVIVLPFLGVLIYLGTQSKHMAERNMRDAKQAQAQMDDYVRSVATEGGAAAEIERAKKLLDSGAISQAEYDQIKQKALASS